MILIDSIIYSLTCVIYLNVPLRYVTYIDYAYAWFISNTKGGGSDANDRDLPSGSLRYVKLF